ncbi:MAG TPA: hypothetical protein VHR39_14720 [Propionibacteriaceae bacterium]|nr:hypothetical protein [Propionibacteriaceae bacterium]
MNKPPKDTARGSRYVSGHADWVRAAGRADPVGLLEALEGV